MDINKILEKIGFPSGSIQRIRLGKGVVGKLASIAIVAIIVLGTLALKFQNASLIFLAFLIIVLFAFYVIRSITKLAEKRPDIALLEGAEFLVYHQKFPLGAKGIVLENQPKELEADPQKPKSSSPISEPDKIQGEGL